MWCHACVVIAVMLAMAGRAHAQFTAAPVLQFPISARSAAMGETGAADNSDPANLYFNPANVVGKPRIYAQGSRWDYAPIFGDEIDIWIGSASAGICYPRDESSRVTSLCVDLAYGRLDYGKAIATDPSGMPLGEFDAYEDYVVLTLGAGIRVATDWELRAGVAAKRIHLNYGLSAPPDEGDISGFAFDTGVTLARDAAFAGWNATPAIAVALVNAGPDLEFPDGNHDPLPMRFHFGGSIRVESPTTRILSADVPVIAMVTNVDAVERFHDEEFSWGIGSELAVAQIVFVRVGVSDYKDEFEFDSDQLSGWGVGVGLPAGPFRARFDFTETSVEYTDDKYGLSIDWLL